MEMKTLLLKGGLSKGDRTDLVNAFFYAGYDTYKEGTVAHSCSQDRPTHRGYSKPAGKIILDRAGKYSFYLINKGEKALAEDHKVLEEIVQRIIN